jgi:hypothetical protein
MNIINCPSKIVRAYAQKNAHKIREIDYGNDYLDGSAYDILLERGWCAEREPGLHTVIEYSVKDTLEVLRSAIPCGCEDCLSGNGWN